MLDRDTTGREGGEGHTLKKLFESPHVRDRCGNGFELLVAFCLVVITDSNEQGLLRARAAAGWCLTINGHRQEGGYRLGTGVGGEGGGDCQYRLTGWLYIVGRKRPSCWDNGLV